MKRLALFTFLAAALAVPGVASASTVVLKVDRASQLVAVTHGRTSVALVHTAAASKLRLGQRVALRARTLRNGTFAANGVRVVGRAQRVRFRGLLLARSHGRTVVSAGGAVISLRNGARTTASANDSGPKPGSEVEVEAQVAGDELETEDVTVVADMAPGGKIEGRLAIGTGTITVSSEHMSLVIKVPAGFDLSKFTSGQDVLATFTQAADGSLTLTQLAGDDDEQEADDAGEIEHGGHDGHGGSDSGDDD